MYITHRYWNTRSVTSMLQHLQWGSLESRRSKIQPKLLYKVVYDLVGIQASDYLGRVEWICYLSPLRAAKVQVSVRIRAVSPEPPLLAHTSSESRGTFGQKARYLVPMNGWACAVKIVMTECSKTQIRLTRHTWLLLLPEPGPVTPLSSDNFPLLLTHLNSASFPEPSRSGNFSWGPIHWHPSGKGLSTISF